MKRGYLTPSQRAELLEKQGGTCCVIGCEETKNLIGEHTIPNAIISGKPDALMCVSCHRLKTKKDMGDIAKAKRREKYQQTGRGRARKGKALPVKNFQPKPEGYKFKWPKRAFRKPFVGK